MRGGDAERCLLAGEAFGLDYTVLVKAAKYAQERTDFATTYSEIIASPPA